MVHTGKACPSFCNVQQERDDQVHSNALQLR